MNCTKCGAEIEATSESATEAVVTHFERVHDLGQR